MWSNLVFTWLAGPAAALLPWRWRKALPFAERVQWVRAGATSGFLEMVTAMVCMGYWYMLTMTPMISHGSEWALLGKYGQEVTEHQVGGAALAIFATHPLTWLLAYAFAEGALRMLAAMVAEDLVGTLPLILLERSLYLAAHPGQAGAMAREFRRNAAATLALVRERAMVARLKEVADELQSRREGAEEILEIRASRRKLDWDPPKIVRVNESYYRLEDSVTRKGERPFCYVLRRLEAGVPGRGVLLYRTGAPAAKP